MTNIQMKSILIPTTFWSFGSRYYRNVLRILQDDELEEYPVDCYNIKKLVPGREQESDSGKSTFLDVYTTGRIIDQESNYQFINPLSHTLNDSYGFYIDKGFTSGLSQHSIKAIVAEYNIATGGGLVALELTAPLDILLLHKLSME